MNIIGKLSTKRLSDTKAGELVQVYTAEHTSFALVMGVNSRRVMVGVLPSAHGSPIASYTRLSLDVKCLSFGTEFVIEPIWCAATRPGNAKHQADSGVLFIVGDAIFIGFQPGGNDPENIMDAELYFDLTNSRVDETYPQEFAAPVLKWNIWEDTEAYNRPNSKALVEVNLL